MESIDDKKNTGIRSRVPRLLLVDDEPMLQFTLRLMLEEFFEVEVADSGRKAQSVIEAQPHFDVVLTDLQMPGGSGQDLYLWAAQAHPELLGRFVFMTGGACSDSARAFLDRADVTSVEKPFEFDTLMSIITEATRDRTPRVSAFA